MSKQAPSTYELNLDNAFENCVAQMVATHRVKSADYAGTGEGVDPYQNFIDVAYQLTLTPGEAVEAHIATKQARLRVLLHKHLLGEGKPLNEPIADTHLDRAVYSIIAFVLWGDGQYNPGSVPELQRWEDGE